MMDLLLAILPPWGADRPPLGISVLSAYLRAQGFEVGCLDVNAWMFRLARTRSQDAGTAGDWPALLAGVGGPLAAWELGRHHVWYPPHVEACLDFFSDPVEELVERVRRERPRAVGLSVYRHNQHLSLAVAQRLRQVRDDLAVILGGPAPPEEVGAALSDAGAIDAFVCGEGEAVLARLAAAAREGGRAAVRAAAGLSSVLLGEPLADLTGTPFPDYADLDLALYESPHVDVITSRGCPNRCRFCTDRLYMGPLRFRPVAEVLEELEHAALRLGRRFVRFTDLTLSAAPERLAELC